MIEYRDKVTNRLMNIIVQSEDMNFFKITFKYVIIIKWVHNSIIEYRPMYEIYGIFLIALEMKRIEKTPEIPHP